MLKEEINNTILIVGASGFIGNVLYKELLPYFDVYGTYCKNDRFYKENKVFFQYNAEEDDLETLLLEVQPAIIISCMKGNFKAQYKAHEQMCKYIGQHHYSRLLFVSSVHVFDGQFRYPSYEDDKPMAESELGKYKLSVEKLLSNNIPAQATILRLPTVLGVNSPVIVQLRQSIKHHATFEVYPNLIISLTTANKVAQQVHYIINKKLEGIFHLSSTDMIHHEDLFIEITSKIGEKLPIFKSVYSSNFDRYLAILPKKNLLPAPYTIQVADVIESCTLNEEISTFKHL